MKKLSYIILVLVSTLLLAWQLPNLFRLVTDEAVRYPFTYYSCVVNDFCRTEVDGQVIKRLDRQGREYSEEQFDSILPMFNYRQLVKDGRLPDSIRGVPVSAKIISQNSFFHRYRPADWDAPSIALYPLFESMSGKVDLQMPNDVFHLTDSVVFFVPDGNGIDAEKGLLYNEALKRRGFIAPARLVAGTPTARKAYDEGYFVVDKSFNVFHMKMVNGKPFVKNTAIDSSLQVKRIMTTEFPDHRFYGFLFDKEDQMYIITTEGYRLQKVEMPPFRLDDCQLFIMANMFYWNVQVTTPEGQTIYALDAKSLRKVDEVYYPRPINNKEQWSSFLFPFVVSFQSSVSQFVMPTIHFSGMKFLYGSLLLGLIYIAMMRRTIKRNYIPLIWVIATGIYGFIACTLLRRNQ